MGGARINAMGGARINAMGRARINAMSGARVNEWVEPAGHQSTTKVHISNLSC